MTRPLAILFLALAVVTATPAGAQPQLIGSIEFEYGAATQAENAEMRERLMSRARSRSWCSSCRRSSWPQKLRIVTEEAPAQRRERLLFDDNVDDHHLLS